MFACAYTRWEQPPEVFHKIRFSKKFRKIYRKIGLRAATLLKKRLQHRRFLVNFANFFRIPILQNDSGTTASICHKGSCYFCETKAVLHNLN